MQVNGIAQSQAHRVAAGCKARNVLDLLFHRTSDVEDVAWLGRISMIAFTIAFLAATTAISAVRESDG
jgi:hypothetical protein